MTSATTKLVIQMSLADLEISRLPGFSWILDAPLRVARTIRPRKKRPIDIRELSPHLRRDIGWD